MWATNTMLVFIVELMAKTNSEQNAALIEQWQVRRQQEIDVKKIASLEAPLEGHMPPSPTSHVTSLTRIEH